MKFGFLLSAILFLQLTDTVIFGQCSIPRADTCDQAEIICSLSEFNEFCCSSSNYLNTTGCIPLCPRPVGGGSSRNTSWWAFRSMGGEINVQVVVFKCQLTGQGLQMGLWADCDCREAVVCKSTCGGLNEFLLTAQLESCKVYYMFVNGCNGDVCDFCLLTSVENEATLPPLNLAPHLTKVCKGACEVKYEVQDTFLCGAHYVWTLDSVVLASNEKNIVLDFPDSGSFRLCVTAYLGNPLSGNICDQDGPICTTIRVVDQTTERRGHEGILCWDQIPFSWHDQVITKSGDYRQTLQDSLSCCDYDSVRLFTLLDRPSVYFVGCIGDTFTDTVTNQTYNTCQLNTLIDHPGKTMLYQCDSSYLLNAVFLNYHVIFREYCLGGKVVIEARTIDRTLTCGNQNLMQDLQYRWYLKNDPARRILGNEAIFEPGGNEEYCLNLTVVAHFGDQTRTCEFDFCEQWDESQLYPYEVCPLGDLILTDKLRGNYFLDSITPTNVFVHNWKVTGGNILTPMGGIDTTEIVVEWDPSASEHKVCYNYISNCGESKECCILVRLVSGTVEDVHGFDFWTVVPNPAYGEIRIIHPSQQANVIEVIDPFGKSAKKFKSIGNGSFDISNLQSGTYFLKIHSRSGTFVRRLMVIR
ncbi:MAG: T9SS type A sorting domain-containing protein [Saprospiraceae bacterium]|nr:T9SS type A sorting domain-containing protein [Saprospiraceae bacterium]